MVSFFTSPSTCYTCSPRHAHSTKGRVDAAKRTRETPAGRRMTMWLPSGDWLLASLAAMLGARSPCGPLAFVSSSSACACTQQRGCELDGQQHIDVYVSSSALAVRLRGCPGGTACMPH